MIWVRIIYLIVTFVYATIVFDIYHRTFNLEDEL